MGFCIKCSERWVGVSAAHCSGCHRTFKGVGAFDKNRVGFECRDPLGLGMECSDKGFWFSTMSETAKAKLGVLQISRL